MANQTDKERRSICGLQDMLTDFDDWLCRYRQYCVRSSEVSASTDDTRTQPRLYLNSLLVKGYIHDKLHRDSHTSCTSSRHPRNDLGSIILFNYLEDKFYNYTRSKLLFWP
ncbi:uncharacterized protein LOC121725493 [Aricia agestis]|uniref:uncharacterized protein LOC121725493 n=1 Tax=Aricia agestis TaxID=91739 RepID=UPI001C20B24B|nr:uncharacterized protein LOC121725493 [Aricia agestis]